MALWGQCQFSLPCVEIQLILLLELFSEPCQGAQGAAYLVFQAGTQNWLEVLETAWSSRPATQPALLLLWSSLLSSSINTLKNLRPLGDSALIEDGGGWLITISNCQQPRLQLTKDRLECEGLPGG